jgi:hypothetical protein
MVEAIGGTVAAQPAELSHVVAPDPGQVHRNAGERQDPSAAAGARSEAKVPAGSQAKEIVGGAVALCSVQQFFDNRHCATGKGSFLEVSIKPVERLAPLVAFARSRISHFPLAYRGESVVFLSVTEERK